jgi:acylphosphatase
MPTSSAREQVRAHVFISGRVQGVGFRLSTVDKALNAGVNGWVRNLMDGRVEAVFEGSQSTVEEMIGWCHQGPSMASVENVAIDYEEPEGLQGFETRR